MARSREQPGVGAVEDLAAVPRTEIDAILLLKAALRHHEAGIGGIGPIGGDLAARLRAAVGSRRGDGGEGHEAEKRCQTERPHLPTLVGAFRARGAPQPLCRSTKEKAP
jgi:hypothetical protein